MSMREAVQNFAKQFEFVPEIKNAEALVKSDTILLAGMGGSHLAADVLQSAYPKLRIAVQSDYGITESADPKTLYVASSYSGNTEEVVGFLETVHAKGLPVVVIATGGKLISYAQENKLPYIQIPQTNIQPRSALGLSAIALAAVLQDTRVLEELRLLSVHLNPLKWDEMGMALAKEFEGKVPVIYASNRNTAVAYNWKIKCNETGKIPAFYNVFPELNHNEMAGFDVIDSTRALSAQFGVLFLKDSKDHERIQTRMQVTQEQYVERGLFVKEIALEGDDRLEKIFNSLILADWFAIGLSELYGTEAEAVPIIEDFKKRISS